jgi:hypothetical protein
MTKAKEIRACKEANPTHKAKDIAKACGVTTTYVYQVLHSAKKKAAKKPVASKEMTPTEGQKIVRKELDRLNEEAESWRDLYFTAFEEVEQLQQDAIGYRAVISYLQAQIDGIAV